MILVIVSLFAFQATAQIRNYVGIVRGDYSPEMVSFLEEYRDNLKENGYTTYAKYVDAYLKGGFGSGFVYVDSDGTNYIITNRHVVSDSASASIEFEDAETGSKTKYENLSIFATDDDIDIAVLKFADGKNPFKTGLSLSSVKVSDGEEVWSAGFPGLGGEPMWQLGKGVITNASSRIKELLDPSISTLYQHSAEIDSGNSGGPLLVKSNSAAGYDVVGINTWKAFYRQNTNYSIPSKVVKDFIDKKVNAGEEDSEKLLKEKTNKLVSKFNDSSEDFTVLAPFISKRAAEKNGKKSLEGVLKYSSTSVRNVVLAAFENSPIEGFRYALASEYWKKYALTDEDVQKYNDITYAKNGNNVTATLVRDENNKKTVINWVEESGIWRIESMSFEGDAVESEESKKEKKSSKSKASISPSYTFAINGGGVVNLDQGGFGASAGMQIFFGDLYGLLLGYEYHPYKPMDVNFNIIDYGVALRIPIDLGSVSLEPVANVSFLSGFGNSRMFLGYKAEAGLQGVWIKNTTMPGLGVTFGINRMEEFMSDYARLHLKNMYIKVYGMVAF